MPRPYPLLSQAWLAAATAISACALASCQMPPKSEGIWGARQEKPVEQVDASCGSVYDDTSVTIRSTGDIIRIQMAWAETDIARRYFDDELEAGALTQAQADLIAQAHCKDGNIGRTFANSGAQAALQAALNPRKPGL